MVRLADIMGTGAPEPPPKPATPRPAVPPAPAAKPVLAPPPIARDKESAFLEACYTQLTACAKALFAQARVGEPLQLAEASLLTAQLPQTPRGQYERVLALIEQPSSEPYLVTHAVNVALLAHHVAACLGYDKAGASDVALAGLVIDIGMAGSLEQITEQPRTLSKQERTQVEQHPAIGVEMLRESRELSRAALQAIGAHHVRPDGRGYPREIPATRANEYASLLSVADAYDAMTHPRSHRKSLNPAQAIKWLIDGSEDQFDRRVVKTLVDELSLYPRGSIVRLNTGEVGVVERVNHGAALRPVMLIHFDASHHPVTPPRQLNLADHPLVYIKEIVVDEAG